MPLGVSIAIAEALTTVAISVLVKLISADLSTITILLFRYALCLPLLLVAAVWQRGYAALAISNYRLLAFRSLWGLLGLSCFYAALDLLSLAKVTTLFQSVTLFVTFLAPLMLGEQVGWRRWAAVVTGFCGAVILLEPGRGDWSPLGVALGLSSPFFSALMLIMLRKLGRTDNALTTAIWYNGFGAVVLALLFTWRGESLPEDPKIMAMILLIGILASFQQFFIAFSHRLAAASLLAPFRYFAVPFGIIAGILFFDEALTVEIVLGSTVIVASSIFILWRESLRRAVS